MSQFPEPVTVPSYVLQQRRERLRQIVKSSLWGMGVRLTIILAELAGVFFFGSASLLMDALASLIDVFSSTVLVVCIWVAAKPPDENHPFGHGRVEPLVGLQLGMFMVLVGGGMLIYQGMLLFRPMHEKVIDSNAWIIPLGAIVLLEISYRMIIRTAKRQNSPALAADAAHYRVDGLTSLIAMIALLTAAYFPEWSHLLDHAGALLIALFMIGLGVNASWQNLNQLVDRAPDNIFFEKVRQAAGRVQGVLGTEKIRIQLSGPNAHVDIDVEVDPNLSVEVAHVISQKVRLEIQKGWPAVQDVTVHIEPYYPGDH